MGSRRKNRSLVESARTMLCESNLSKWWWAEAVNTANYIQNRVVSQTMNCIPYERMFGEPPKLDDLHKFGEEVYTKIPDAKRRKLDDKAVKMMFLGYMCSKGYRLGDVKSRKVIISREVKFMSNKCVEFDLVYKENEAENSDVESVKDEDKIQTDCERDETEPDNNNEHSQSLSDKTESDNETEEENETHLRRSQRKNIGTLPAHLNDCTINER